jgi:hypothetical protein
VKNNAGNRIIRIPHLVALGNIMAGISQLAESVPFDNQAGRQPYLSLEYINTKPIPHDVTRMPLNNCHIFYLELPSFGKANCVVDLRVSINLALH